MKTGFSKFFSKLRKEEDGQRNQLDPSSFDQLSKQDLITMVLKYDTQLKEAYMTASTLSEEKKEARREQQKQTDAMTLYKTHLEEIRVQYQDALSELDECKRDLETRTLDNDLLRKKIVNYEETLQHYKERQYSTVASDDDLEALRESLKARSRECAELRMQRENLKAEMEKIQGQLGRVRGEAEGQKEKLEQAAVDLRHRLERAEKQLNKKEEVIQELQVQRGAQEENGVLVAELEELRAKVGVVEEMEERVKEKEGIIEELNRRVQELEQEREEQEEGEVDSVKAKYKRKLNDLQSSISAKDAEISRLHLQISSTPKDSPETLSQLTYLNAEVDQLKQDKAELSSKIEQLEQKLQKSTEAQEKVRQQLQEASRAHTEPIVNPYRDIPMSNTEFKAMLALKNALDSVYRMLMKLMVSATTTNSDNHQVAYIIRSSDFAQFERELNRVVMDVHEACEHPTLMDSYTDTSWSARISNAVSNLTTSRLLSCVVR